MIDIFEECRQIAATISKNESLARDMLIRLLPLPSARITQIKVFTLLSIGKRPTTSGNLPSMAIAFKFRMPVWALT